MLYCLLMIGETIGNYRIVDKIGEGGMGVVYLAEHGLIGKKAAIKVLLPELSSNQEIVNRFFNEARSTTLIKHPGLIEIFDYGHHQSGSAYIIMEYLEGDSLSKRIHFDGHVAIELVLAIARQIASALGAVHVKGVVHRDLKPDNIFLVPDRDIACGFRVKVLDFGIAKLAQAGSATMTRTGIVIGTPLYMSPEQCRGSGEVDARSDIYSLGCIMYEMGCGRPPIIGEGPGEILAAHIYENPPVPSSLEPGIPPRLDEIIVRCLAKNVQERYQSMEELGADLDALWWSVFGGSYETPAAGLPTLDRRTPPPLKTPTPTTLGASASELAPEEPPPSPKKSRKAIVAVALGLVVAIGGTLAFVFKGGGGSLAGGGGEGQSSGTVAAAAANQTGGTDGGVTGGAPASATVPAAAAASSAPATAVAAAAPARLPVKLKVESEPSGAEVYRVADGVLIGRTPMTMEMQPTTGEVVFIVKHSGYKEARAALQADRDGSTLVKLAAQKNTPSRPRPSGGGGSVGNGAVNPFD
ncbi:MAG: serine/threonine-protein kinase [Pseudomonadota bacterium]